MQLTNRQIFQNHLAIPSKLSDPLEIVKAEGIYIYSDTGKRYIDLVSGVSVSNVGHLHPKVIEAIACGRVSIEGRKVRIKGGNL